MNFIIYNDIGQILRVGSCSEDDFDKQTANSELIIEGVANQSTQYIDDGSIIDMPPKPDGFYSFNYQTKEWDLDSSQTITSAKYKRNQLLQDSDYTQLPDVQLANKENWAIYRQQLRDMTDNDFLSGNFPISPKN